MYRAIILDNAYFQRCKLEGILTELGVDVVSSLEDFGSLGAETEESNPDVAFIDYSLDTNFNQLILRYKDSFPNVDVIVCCTEEESINLLPASLLGYECVLKKPYDLKKVDFICRNVKEEI